jgi:hypothetical protein
MQKGNLRHWYVIHGQARIEMNQWLGPEALLAAFIFCFSIAS